MSGKIAGNIQVKLYVDLRWLFANISGCMCSFGLASCVVQDIIWYKQGQQAIHSSGWQTLIVNARRCTAAQLEDGRASAGEGADGRWV